MPAITTGFGQEIPRVALLAVIDDATGRVPAAYFAPTENARGYLTLLRQVVLKTGVPGALYSPVTAPAAKLNGR